MADKADDPILAFSDELDLVSLIGTLTESVLGWAHE